MNRKRIAEQEKDFLFSCCKSDRLYYRRKNDFFLLGLQKKPGREGHWEGKKTEKGRNAPLKKVWDFSSRGRQNTDIYKYSLNRFSGTRFIPIDDLSNDVAAAFQF